MIMIMFGFPETFRVNVNRQRMRKVSIGCIRSDLRASMLFRTDGIAGTPFRVLQFQSTFPMGITSLNPWLMVVIPAG